MNPQLIAIIAVNIGILLLISWGLSLFVFLRLHKERNQLKEELARYKNNEKQKNNDEKSSDNQNGPDDSIDFLHTINNLNNELKHKAQQLDLLQERLEQQANSSNNDNNNDDLMIEFKENGAIIDELKQSLSRSQANVHSLEIQLGEGRHKDSRIAILEEKEGRLKNKVTQLKAKDAQATKLAESLRKSKVQNRMLRDENDKLRENIKQLANASEEQLETIRRITIELEKANRLETHQKKIISELREQIEVAKQNGSEDSVIEEFEDRLTSLNATLERTQKEKEFMESYFVEMDEALKNAEETERALQRAQAEIASLEQQFPEIKIEDKEQLSNLIENSLPNTIPIDEENEPALYELMVDNRLFGILNEHWSTFDAAPLQLVANKNITLPNSLTQWSKTSFNNDIYTITLGISDGLSAQLTQLLNVESSETTKQLGQIVTTALANELDPSFDVKEPETIENIDSTIPLALETLISSDDEFIYMSLRRMGE